MQTLRQFDDNYEGRINSPFDFDNQHWKSWLESEGFEHITDKTEDSYGFLQHYPDERYNAFLRNNYWYWIKCLDCFIFRIYVFRNCVVVDKDWDCGGNRGGRVYEFECWSIEDIWNDIIEYINENIE